MFRYSVAAITLHLTPSRIAFSAMVSTGCQILGSVLSFQPISRLICSLKSRSQTLWPTRPCSPTLTPVANEAMLALVVAGNAQFEIALLVSNELSQGACPLRCCICSAPRPSISTTKTFLRAESPNGFASASTEDSPDENTLRMFPKALGTGGKVELTCQVSHS